MSSFLANCPECGCTFAVGNPCPQCRWVDSSQAGEVNDAGYCEEFAVRFQRHKRNTSIHMTLLAATGFIGFSTAAMWALFLYRGSIFGFILVGFLTVTSGVLAACTCLAKTHYSTKLHCPACDGELDELGMDLSNCPACDVQLIDDGGNSIPQQQDTANNLQETVGV